MTEASPNPRPFRIGVVSDTHGELPEAVLAVFEGVSAIVHAGDCGSGTTMATLETIAPVTAVSGNCDVGSEAMLPIATNVVLGGVRVIVAHRDRDLAGSLDPVRAGARVAIIGHSHVSGVGERDGVLWVNPGSPSFPRNGQSPSVAIISVAEDGSVTAEVVPLA